MSTKHTPGPWSADKWATGYTVSAPESHYSVCHLEDCSNAEANAHLIAAAPNLLEACKLALDSFGSVRPEAYAVASRHEFDVLTAAIALATGEAKKV